MFHNVLIVDDEPAARSSILYLIDWEQYGFKVAEQAEDGEEACLKLREGGVDLVITDIRMPVMDGLELIKQAKQEAPGTRFVIMSGYEEFGFVKRAMEMGVVNYLLKPVEKDELIKVLRIVKADLEQSILLDRRLQLGMPAIRGTLAKKWALGRIPVGELQEVLSSVQLDGLRFGSAACLIVGAVGACERQTPMGAIQDIAEQAVGGRGEVFQTDDGHIGLLVFDARDIAAFAERIRIRLLEELGVAATIGCGHQVRSAEEVPASYAAALSALKSLFRHGPGKVLLPDPAEAEPPAVGGDSYFEMLDAIAEKAASLHPDQAVALLDRLWRRFDEDRLRENAVRLNALRLVGKLNDLSRDDEQEEQQEECQLERDVRDYGFVTRAATMRELYLFIEKRCRELAEEIRSRHVPHSQLAVNEVKQYVLKHYDENLTLRVIARQMFLNSSYIGRMFKAQEGIAFNDYLLKVRMEKAKELLRSRELKIYEVAKRVGYQEVDWFYKKFKEYTGVSASSYQAMKLADRERTGEPGDPEKKEGGDYAQGNGSDG